MLENNLAFAQKLDGADPLHGMRNQFHIPRHQGHDEIYLCGNSLGLQPKRTADYVDELLKDWQQMGVKGHFAAKHSWLPYHEFLTEASAQLVGALPQEVICMNSLTVNLHLLMVSFYRPSKERYKILIEDHAFPSDHYAVESQLRFHGLDPKEALVLAKPRAGEDCLRQEDLVELIKREGKQLALVLLPGVQYYTGEVLDMAAISEAGHAVGATVGFDLAHAVGNIVLNLHDWNVDFAAWCSYKYLNSGPGSVAGAFVHEKHLGQTLPRFHGWWGQNKSIRFQMGPEFDPIPTAEAWQLSNPPILSLAAVRASLDTFMAAGGMHPLRKKSLELTGYLRWLLEQELGDAIHVLTPYEPRRHGAQLSLTVKLHGQSAKQVQQKLEDQGVTCDFREPNVMRAAPAPLYNSFEDVWRFVQILKKTAQG
ncbi:kynureninase [Permianibacter sp. IMCC34836]|uniref:kynureninase n=1 Tax=Permianibacter fluminis TaxID=2738515 RepID=UPI0015565811|nr:kynureninase [Permianibacter fluminis]NQD39071.1 kynureninase [Permianibacter fluminis]